MNTAATIIDAVWFAGAGAVAVVTIVGTIAPQWRRIASLMLGRVEPISEPVRSVDRWRRVHAEADRRAPFAVEGRRA
jgi:hypothetical protein